MQIKIFVDLLILFYFPFPKLFLLYFEIEIAHDLDFFIDSAC